MALIRRPCKIAHIVQSGYFRRDTCPSHWLQLLRSFLISQVVHLIFLPTCESWHNRSFSQRYSFNTSGTRKSGTRHRYDTSACPFHGMRITCRRNIKRPWGHLVQPGHDSFFRPVFHKNQERRAKQQSTFPRLRNVTSPSDSSSSSRFKMNKPIPITSRDCDVPASNGKALH